MGTVERPKERGIYANRCCSQAVLLEKTDQFPNCAECGESAEWQLTISLESPTPIQKSRSAERSENEGGA
jgi:hypothetical protein